MRDSRNLAILIIVALIAEALLIWAFGWVTYEAADFPIKRDVYGNIVLAVIGMAASVTALIFYYRLSDKFVGLADDKVSQPKMTEEEIRINEINKQIHKLVAPEPDENIKPSTPKVGNSVQKQLTLDSPVIREAEKLEEERRRIEDERKRIEKLAKIVPDRVIEHEQLRLKVAMLKRLADDIEAGKISVVPENMSIESDNINKVIFRLKHTSQSVPEDEITLEDDDSELVPEKFKVRKKVEKDEEEEEQAPPQVQFPSSPESENGSVMEQFETVEEEKVEEAELEEEPRQRGRGRIRRRLDDEPLTPNELSDELSRKES